MRAPGGALALLLVACGSPRPVALPALPIELLVAP